MWWFIGIPPIAFFPAVAGMVTAYLLARRYNFF
jgi:hypothetical protein